MIPVLRSAVAAAALSVFLAAPAFAVENNSAGRLTFTTQLTDNEPAAPSGAYDGVLNLTVGSDGTVSGFYREEGQALERDVTGGMQGDKIWLNIGGANPLHIDGTLHGGSLVGYTMIGSDVYKFAAAASQPQL